MLSIGRILRPVDPSEYSARASDYPHSLAQHLRYPVLAVRKPARDFVGPSQPAVSARIWRILFCTDPSMPALHVPSLALSLTQESGNPSAVISHLQ